MAKNKIKREALTVTRLIHEVLVSQLNIPLGQIVNDATFKDYTGSQRPDLLISEFEFNGKNDRQYIDNLLAYAEIKDDCSLNDANWKDAYEQGLKKASLLNLPYFIVTNCKTSVFYNAVTGKELLLNNNPIREFQTIDIFRLIKTRLKRNPTIKDILTNVDSISTISEATFNKKLWEIKGIYRGISFKNNIEKIDFTIGFIALEYYEEKAMNDGQLDNSKLYWSSYRTDNPERLVAGLSQYISRLERETDFKEFKELIESVKTNITGVSGKSPLVGEEEVKLIYDIIDTMRPLHNSGFDLFGAVYEMFANSNEKKEFGEFFTRRHYTQVFSKLLLQSETHFSSHKKFSILDLACGTGGFLTESFKVLQNNYLKSDTLNNDALKFLKEECFYGIDSREENVLRTKLNMFLVGDGHTNIIEANTLTRKYSENETYDYILTNPPYGDGTIYAEADNVSSKRLEVAFLFKIIKLLKVGGKACVILPDGILESPSFRNLRLELLQKCSIQAIISLPKFAFAPYTKEKTYALFITKKSTTQTQIQNEDIWMYIIDNDGLANSDKRYPTKLRNNRNCWKHDEISGWVSTEGEEKKGLLEERWLKFDDKRKKGTTWIDEKKEVQSLRKGGKIKIRSILKDKYLTILPEFYLRPYVPSYIDIDSLRKRCDDIDNLIKAMIPWQE